MEQKIKLDNYRIKIVAFVSIFLFYLATACPTMGLGDVAILLDAIANFRITTHVNNHPMTVMFGWLFYQLPFDDLTYRCNLQSVFFGSIAVFIFFLATLNEFKKKSVAIIAGLTLMLSQSMWWHSTLLENYCFNALFTALFILLLTYLNQTKNPRYLYILFFISALAVFNHVQMSFLGVACIVCYILHFLSLKNFRTLTVFFGCFGSCLLGALPWLITFLIDLNRMKDFSLVLHEAFFGSFEYIMLKGSFLMGLKYVLMQVAFQVPNLYLIFIPIGIFYLFKRWKLSPALITLLTELILNTTFFMFYNTWDRFAFLLPSFIILIFIGSFGINKLFKCLDNPTKTFWLKLTKTILVLSIVISSCLYLRIGVWSKDPHSFWSKFYTDQPTINTHRLAAYLANPNKRYYTDVDQIVRSILGKLPENSVYIDDDSRLYYPVSLYQKIYSLRFDIDSFVINSWDLPNWGLVKDEYTRFLEAAYLTDVNLFIVSDLYPFISFNSFASAYRKFSFSRFDLGQKHWIYKLDTQQKFIDSPASSKVITPLNTGSDIQNISRRNLGIFKDINLIMQDMRTFGDNWTNGDQLFAAGYTVGSYFDLLITSEKSFVGSIDIKFTTGPDFGIVKVYNNLLAISDDIDLYSPLVETKTISLPVNLAKGTQALKFKLVGQSPNSSGLIVGVDSIQISPR